MAESEELRFTRIDNDTCGNPRYVVHFLELLTPHEQQWRGMLDSKYATACKRANTIGGRKYHTKRYGGGIVFQSYSIDETAKHISRVTGRRFVAVKD